MKENRKNLTVAEFIKWHQDKTIHISKNEILEFPHPSEELLKEMVEEGITLEIRDGAPYLNTDNWIYGSKVNT